MAQTHTLPADAVLPRPAKSRGRISHIVRGNARGNVPQHRIYVDTEAFMEYLDPERQRQTLWFGWACYERARPDRDYHVASEDWLHFTTAEQFFAWCEQRAFKRTCTYIYAHNLQYDAALLALSTMAAVNGWTVTEYVPANHLLWLTLRKDTRTLLFVDTLNYFPTSLATLGKNIGVLKAQAEQYPQPVAWWSAYCRQDVTVIQAAMRSYFTMIVEHDLGAYRKTAAGQAYGAWRHRFMSYPVLILADERIEALERSAYHGGRCEVFYDTPITEPLFALDINSMYPWVMRDGLFPHRKALKGRTLSLEKLAEILADYAVVARVRVNTDEPVYPYQSPERILYPVGCFETSLSSPELTYALEHGHIEACYEWVSYEQAPLFRDYVETLYQLRRDYAAAGNIAFAYLCKLLLNSLYGKFGQRGFRWMGCPNLPPDFDGDVLGNCEAGGPVLTHRVRFGETWHREQASEAFESFPAIAAHVTAAARMALWRLRMAASAPNVYYCDTDSLYVNEAGYGALQGEIDPAQLGRLKLEGAYRAAHFRAPKDYRVDSTERIKGVRGNAVQLAPDAYEQVQFESYDRVLARGADGEIVVTFITKRLTRRNLQSQGEGVGWRLPLQVFEPERLPDRLSWQFERPRAAELVWTHRAEAEEAYPIAVVAHRTPER